MIAVGAELRVPLAGLQVFAKRVSVGLAHSHRLARHGAREP